MAYDSESDRLILFGGFAIEGVAGDTWAYDLAANTWTNMAPRGPNPSARDGQAMAYDSNSDRILMYGGDGSSDVWAYDFDSNTWTQKKDAPFPALFSRRWHTTPYPIGRCSSGATGASASAT